MTGLLDLLTILVFACVLMGFYGLLGLSKRRQRAALSAQRLAELRKTIDPADDSEVVSILKELQATPLGRVPILRTWMEKIWVSIALVGWRPRLGLRVGLTALGGLLFGIAIGRETPYPVLLSPVIAVIAACTVFLLMLRSAEAKYFKTMRQTLPEAIDALNRTCRAGVPVSSAFILVASHMHGPLATEFRIIDHWLRLGVPLRRVMQDSAKRVPLAEYHFFAVILIINQESGGRLGETLDRLSATLRERHELQLKVMAKTSEARASAKIVAALVPGMMAYMYFNAPEDFRFLLSDPTGNLVLVYALGSVTLGLVIIQLMIRRVR